VLTFEGLEPCGESQKILCGDEVSDVTKDWDVAEFSESGDAADRK
jgi:hypothetical protein